MTWLWLIVPVAILAIGGGLFLAVQNHAFTYGLIKDILTDIIKASIPLFKNKPKTPEEWKAQREAQAAKMNRHS